MASDRDNEYDLKQRWEDINRQFGWTLQQSKVAVELYDEGPLSLDRLAETPEFATMHIRFAARTGLDCTRRTLLDHLYSLRKAARKDDDTGKRYRILGLKRGDE